MSSFVRFPICSSYCTLSFWAAVSFYSTTSVNISLQKNPADHHDQQGARSFSPILNCSEASLRQRFLLAGGFRYFFLGPIQFFQAKHLVLGILQSQMGICVHGDANVRMTHQVLQCLWIHAGASHVATLPAPSPNGRVAGLVFTLFHFPKIIPECLTSNPLPQIVTSNPRLQPYIHFAVDMFPYKKTELLQKSGFKSQPPKKPGNTPLSGT